MTVALISITTDLMEVQLHSERSSCSFRLSLRGLQAPLERCRFVLRPINQSLNPNLSPSTGPGPSCVPPLPDPQFYLLLSISGLKLTPAFITSPSLALKHSSPTLSLLSTPHPPIAVEQIGVTSRQGSNGSEPEPSGSAVSHCGLVECVQ